MKAKTFIIFLFLLNSAFSQTIKKNINELMTAYSENEKFNGTVLVKKGNQIFYENAFGLANREWDINNETDSKFLIGSLSKSFTALITLILVDEDLIDLNGTIGDYIPNYKSVGKDKVTVHQLLTHTSGLPDLGQINNFSKKRIRWIYNSKEYIKLINELDSIYNPNENFKYNNLGYNLLALICESVTNTEFGELLEEKIFVPLGMTNTSLDKNLTIDKKRANGYEWHLLKGYMNPSYIENCHIKGLGGILTTAKDLELYSTECFEKQELMSNLLYDEMFTPHEKDWQNYGYGWWITNKKIDNDSLKIISHGGSIDGYKSYFTRVVNDSLTIIILRNSYIRTQLGNIDLYHITNQIINIFYNQEYSLPKKSIAREMGYIIGQSGINEVIKKYANFMDSADYYINENEFNQLGKELIENYKLTEESKEIYKLGLNEFPNSFLLNFSFGTILYNDKNDRFTKYYKKCVDLYSANPENKKFESDYKLALRRIGGDE